MGVAPVTVKRPIPLKLIVPEGTKVVALASVMAILEKAFCLRITVPPDSVTVQPSAQPPAAGANVTVVLRVTASLRACTSAEKTSKLAFFIRVATIKFLKSGPAIAIKMTSITTTIINSIMVKPRMQRILDAAPALGFEFAAENELMADCHLPFISRRLVTLVIQR